MEMKNNLSAISPTSRQNTPWNPNSQIHAKNMTTNIGESRINGCEDQRYEKMLGEINTHDRIQITSFVQILNVFSKIINYFFILLFAKNQLLYQQNEVSWDVPTKNSAAMENQNILERKLIKRKNPIESTIGRNAEIINNKNETKNEYHLKYKLTDESKIQVTKTN